MAMCRVTPFDAGEVSPQRRRYRSAVVVESFPCGTTPVTSSDGVRAMGTTNTKTAPNRPPSCPRMDTCSAKRTHWVRVRAEAGPLHVGGTLIVVQTDVWDDHGRRVAQTTQTQAVIAPRPPTDF